MPRRWSSWRRGASRRARCAPATRSPRSPTRRLRPGGHDVCDRTAGAEAPELVLHVPADGLQGQAASTTLAFPRRTASTSERRRIRRESVRGRRRGKRLPSGRKGGESASRRPVSSSEKTSSRSSSGGDPGARRGRRPRPAGGRGLRCAARPASRSRVGLDPRNGSRRPAGAGRAPSCRVRDRVETGLELVSRQPARFVLERRARQPEGGGGLAELPAQRRDELRPRQVELGPEDRHRSLHGSSVGPDARAGAAKGLVALRQSPPVLGGEHRQRWCEPAQHPVVAAAAGPPLTIASRSGMNARPPSRMRSSSAEATAAPFRPALPSPGAIVTSVSPVRPLRPYQPHARRLVTEAHQRGSARVRGENPARRRAALRGGWSSRRRFGRRRHQPRLEAEVERGVRAKAPERGPRDQQPASLIGMIR